jgi:hypothetical protein
MFSDKALDVFLGDPSAESSPRNLCQIDVVFLGDLPNQRTRAHPSLLARLRLRFCFRLRSLGGRRWWGTEAVGAAAFAGDGEAPSPSPAITPTTVFTCTVFPACTLISCSVPEAGAGISASTLSVEISNNGSSRCTFSPGCFSHLVMVPSKIDSPIWGMTTSVGMVSFRGVAG